MSRYLSRVVDAELDALGAPAVALEGAKAVGKTITALRRAGSSHALDDPRVAQVVAADVDRALSGPSPVLLDEWQRVPEVWDAVRRAVDAGAGPDSFLLTGSVTPAQPDTHTGAGRILRVRMHPLSLQERQLCPATVSLAELLTGGRPAVDGASQVGLAEYAEEIVASGLPAVRSQASRLRRAQLDGYVERLLDRDFAEAGREVRNPAALRRWLTGYAAAVSSTTSQESIARALGTGEAPTRVTTQAYRETLQRLWILDPVPGWLPTRNHLRALAAAPKHQLADPALAATLLGLDADALLEARTTDSPLVRDGALFGALFESLVTLSVRVYAQANEARVRHLRTHRGEHEIDLVVERRDGRVLAVETKLAATVSDADVRHLTWLGEQIGPDLLDAVVVTTGREAYRRADGIAVVPAALLGP